MAVDPHSSAIRRTIRAAPARPRSRPPTSTELSAPRSPANFNASIDSDGKEPFRSTAAAVLAMVVVHTRSSAASYVSALVFISPRKSTCDELDPPRAASKITTGHSYLTCLTPTQFSTGDSPHNWSTGIAAPRTDISKQTE